MTRVKRWVAHLPWRKHRQQRKRVAFVALLVLITLIPLVVYQLRKAGRTEAWHNDSFKYRQKITVTDPGNIQAGYQYSYTLDTAALVTAGKMRSDCADLRLINTDGSHLTHPYWVERCNTTTTRVWIKFTSTYASNFVVWLYYGNPALTESAYTGEEVFEFFDDFNGTSIDANKWTLSATDYSYSSGVLRLNTGFARNTDPLPFNLNDGYLLESRMMYYTLENAFSGTLTGVSSTVTQGSNAGADATVLFMRNANTRDVYRYIGSGSAASYNIANGTNTFTSADNTWYVLSERYHSNGAALTRDYANEVSHTFTWSKNLTYINLGYFTGNSNLQDTGYDWVRVRKYSASDPTFTLSSQEQAPAPTAYWKFDEGTNQTVNDAVTKTEQYINLINKTYYSNSTSWMPTDNSLGIIRWDGTQYSGTVTVYLEVIMTDNYDFWNGASVGLFTTAGASVAGGSIGIGDSNSGRFRSGAITGLVNGTDYTVKVADGSTDGVTLYAARLVVVQSDPNKLTQTENQIDMGSDQTVTNDTYAALLKPRIYGYDASKFDPVPTSYLEATLKRDRPPTIEQHIEILNQAYSSTSTSWMPTDNSLGLVHWDGTKYSGTVTVYLEVVMTDVYDFFNGASAALFDASGNSVAGSSISIGDQGSGRFRSGAITGLVDGTDYTVRVADGSTDGVNLYAARLVVIQSDTTRIARTEGQIEVGAYQTAITSTAATELTDKKVYLYDDDLFTPAVETSGDASFSASLKIDDASDTVYAELYNQTNSTVVATVSHSGNTNWTLVTATNIDNDADWDTTNDDEYIVRVYCADGASDGCSGNIGNAKIHLIQSDANGITDLEIIHQQVMYTKTDTDSTYANAFMRTRFNPGLEVTQASFGSGILNYYYEATLKTTGSTGYARLLNVTSGAAITGSEVSTTATSYSRQRSGSITANMPATPAYSTAQEMDTQLRNTDTNTTSVSSSRLIIQVSDLSTAGTEPIMLELYDLTASASVANSEISSTNPLWTRVRSSGFSLTDGHEYVVRIKGPTAVYTGDLLGAKLIHQQANTTTGIKKTQIMHTLNPYLKTSSSSSYGSLTTYILYTPTNFVASHIVGAYFDATLKTSAGTAYARLSNGLGEVSTANTDYTRVRSGDFSSQFLSSATIDMQIRNSATNTTSTTNGSLVLNLDATYTSAFDQMGVHHGNLQGPSWQQPSECVSHMCLAFDGVDDRIKIKDHNGLDFTTAFTISGWIKTTATSGIVLAKHNTTTGTDGGYKLYLTNGKLVAGFDSDATSFPVDSATSVTSVNNNVWHHFAVVKTDAGLYLYINGILESTDSSVVATSTSVNSDILYIGVDGDGGSTPFAGSLDEVRLYPYARTQSDIQNEATRGNLLGSTALTSITAGMVGFWKLDESSGPAADLSGRGNTASWQGNATAAAGKFSQGLTLDGTGDYGLVATPAGIPSNWYGSSWTKRKPITITNTNATALTDYQVKLTVPYDTDMQMDFDDLRFMSAGGNNLDYWIESFSMGSTATVWVEVDTLAANADTTIYVYYGNAAATAASNGDTTFIYHEDFKGIADGSDITTLSGWTKDVDYNSTYTIQNEKLRMYHPASAPNEANDFTRWTFTNPVTVNHVAEADVTVADSTSWDFQYAITGSGNLLWSAINNETWQGSSGSWATAQSGLAVGTTYTLGGLVNFDTDITKMYVNDVYKIDRAFSASIASTTYLHFGNYGYNTINSTWYVDNIKVRKIATTQPTASLSNEETFGNAPAALTVSAWVKGATLDTSNRVIVARGNSEVYSWAIYTDNTNAGILRFTADGTTIGTSQTTLAANQWYLVTMVADTTTARLYINGTLDATTTSSGILTGGTALGLGADPDGTNGWNGIIDEVRIYNRVLTEVEISRLYGLSIGPVADYDLNENTGSTAYDRSGNNYELGISGASWSLGKYGSALTFDGIDDYLSRADTDGLDFSSEQSFTLETWFKHGTAITGTDTLLSKGYGYKLYMNNTGTISCGIDTDSSSFPQDSASSTTNFADNKWHHLVCVKDGTTSLTLFIDGTKAASDTEIAASGTYANTTGLYVGVDADGTSNPWEGQLDEIKIYPYALNPTDHITTLNANHPIGGSPTASYVGYWNMDEGNGTTINDKGYGKQNGSITSATWSMDGKANKALSFNGTTSYIDLGNQNSGPLHLTNRVSVTAWVKLASVSGSRAIVSKAAGGQIMYELAMTNANPQFSVRNVSATSTTALQTDTWYHLAGTWDKDVGKITLYINGKVAATNNLSLESVYAQNVNIGRRSSGFNYFSGLIDEVKIYGTALTPEQVAVDMNQGSATALGPMTSAASAYCIPGDATACSAPAAHWKMDENGGNTAIDSSSNQQTLTFLSSGQFLAGKIGSAVVFNSANSDYMSAADSPNLSQTGSLTLMTWIKPTAVTADTLFTIAGKWEGSNQSYLLSQYGDELRFYVDSSNNYATTTAANLQPNVWHHVAAAYNATAQIVTFYVNGIAQAASVTGTIPGSIGDDSSRFIVGTQMNLSTLSLQPDATDGIDNTTNSNSPDANNGISNIITTRGVGSTTRNGLFKFNISSLSGKNTLSRTMTLWTMGAMAVDAVHTFYRILPANSGWDEASTWNYVTPTTTRWAGDTGSDGGSDAGGNVAGTDYSSTPLGSFTMAASEVAGTQHAFSLDKSEFELMANSNAGILMKNNVNGATAVYSSDHTTAGQRPLLVVDYEDPVNFYLGSVDDLKLYSYVRTPAQIAWDYNKGGPLLWYKFDECQGTTTYNSALNNDGKAMGLNGTIAFGTLGNTSTGTCNSGAATEMWNDGSSGKFNASLGFDGEDDAVSTADNSLLRFDAATSDFSLFAWVKRAAVDSADSILTKLDAADDGWQLIINADNTVTCSVDALDISSTVTLDTAWHHVGCVVDRDGNGQVYIDGLPNGDVTAINSEAMATTATISIGSTLNGLMDDVRIYPYTVTPTQIKTIMNNGGVRFD